MKFKLLQLFAVLIIGFYSTNMQAQVTVGSNEEPLSVSLLEIVSDYQEGLIGGLRLPLLTASEINQLKSSILKFSDERKAKALGLMVFNTTSNCVNVWNGNDFMSFCGEIGPATMTPDCEKIQVFPIIRTDLPYQQGKHINIENDSCYILFPVSVTKNGTYSITASTGNGYSFIANGTLLDVGNHVLKLMGQGTPIKAGINDLTFQINGMPYEIPTNICSVPQIEVAKSSDLASFTIKCNDASYPTKINGSYVQGVTLTSDNTIEFYVEVTKTGSASFYADVSANGMNFSGTAKFDKTGTHKIVMQGKGTPLNVVKNQEIIIEADDEEGSCTAYLNVLYRSIKIMGLGTGIYQPYTASASEAARAILKNESYFGPNDNSIIKLQSVDILSGGISQGTALQKKINDEDPDIIIAAHSYSPTAASVTILEDFVKNKKGVVIVCIEDNSGGLRLMNAIFDVNNITRSDVASSSVWEIKDIPGDPIIEGPFSMSIGGLAGKYFGLDYGGNDKYDNIPEGQYISYSAAGENIFIRHQTLGYIQIGDGGTFAGSTSNNSTDIYPSKITAGGVCSIKPYGPSATRQDVYNSYLYANIIAWAIDYVKVNKQ